MQYCTVRAASGPRRVCLQLWDLKDRDFAENSIMSAYWLNIWERRRARKKHAPEYQRGLFLTS